MAILLALGLLASGRLPGAPARADCLQSERVQLDCSLDAADHH